MEYEYDLFKQPDQYESDRRYRELKEEAADILNMGLGRFESDLRNSFTAGIDLLKKRIDAENDRKRIFEEHDQDESENTEHS